ncbi:MAG: flippase-like domain-containing protein [Candidatus Omnitrophica bacterium]|nr:flippase-like domain-containing protein [Candidatus Omnitrophota bacterium]
MNRTVKNIIKLLVIAVCLVLIGLYFREHTEDLSIIRNIKPADVLILVATAFAINIFYSVKMLIILRHQGLKGISFLEWLEIFIVSRFLTLHIPQAALIYRSAVLKDRYQFAYTHTVSATSFFVWFELSTMLLMSIFVLIFLSPEHNPLFLKVLIFLGIIAALCIICPFIFRAFFQSVVPKGKRLGWIFGKLYEVSHAMTVNARNASLILKIQLLNIVSFVLQLLWLSVCFRALELPASIPALVLFLTTIHLTGFITLLPGNFGILELIAGYMAHIVGWTLGAGIIISVVRRIIVYLNFSVFGLFFVILKLFGWKNKIKSSTNH